MSDSPQIKLEYQIAPKLHRRRAPAWVWTVVVVYLLMWAVLLMSPMWLKLAGADIGGLIAAGVAVALLALCGLALLVTPVRLSRDRPMSRRGYLVPMIAASLLIALLLLGATIAVAEAASTADATGNNSLYFVGGAVAAWIAWGVVLFLASANRNPLSLAARFHRWLLGGSVAELLVAVPCHVIVRRRDECCAGLWTGTAICLGAMVMFIAFGPSVLLLYYRRARQISPR